MSTFDDDLENHTVKRLKICDETCDATSQLLKMFRSADSVTLKLHHCPDDPIDFGKLYLIDAPIEMVEKIELEDSPIDFKVHFKGTYDMGGCDYQDFARFESAVLHFAEKNSTKIRAPCSATVEDKIKIK